MWSDAATTPAVFASRATQVNTTLLKRNVAAALAFVERVNRYLQGFEDEPLLSGL
jgi:hypothetical protein